jgi:hypothetical protein
MTSPERIVDIHVDALHQAGDELGVVGLFTGIETQVLQQLYARRQFCQPRAHLIHRVLRVWRAFGSAEVRRGDHNRPTLG